MAVDASAILVVTGVLTAGAGIGAILPRQIFKLLFGAVDPDAPMILVVRHWALLVALVGCLLVYAGYHPVARVPVMVVGIVEKFAIAALVLASPFRKRPAVALVAAADAVMAALYVLLLTRPGS
ncbi:MAG: hypothetical protein WB615_15610 [Candidatus Tumulicola sp.]